MMESDDLLCGRLYRAVTMLEDCGEFAALVPEVRSNFVYARENPQSREDVLAVDGRITVVDGMPKAAGRLKFGASSHMARLMVEVHKRDGRYRAGVDFANNPELADWLERYCQEKGWVFSVMDRSTEPDDVKAEEGASMPWKVGKAFEAAGGKTPKMFYETGAVGKEPVTVLIGGDPVEVAEEMRELAVKWAER